MKYDLEAFNFMSNSEFTVEVESSQASEVVKSYYSTIGISSILCIYRHWVDFPTIETFFRVFINNKQKTFEKLYLDDEGNISTRFVFTVEEK